MKLDAWKASFVECSRNGYGGQQASGQWSVNSGQEKPRPELIADENILTKKEKKR
jgi:hypothetical protein